MEPFTLLGLVAFFAVKAWLRSRGLSESDIEKLAPGERARFNDLKKAGDTGKLDEYVKELRAAGRI